MAVLSRRLGCWDSRDSPTRRHRGAAAPGVQGTPLHSLTEAWPLPAALGLQGPTPCSRGKANRRTPLRAQAAAWVPGEGQWASGPPASPLEPNTGAPPELRGHPRKAPSSTAEAVAPGALAGQRCAQTAPGREAAAQAAAQPHGGRRGTARPLRAGRAGAGVLLNCDPSEAGYARSQGKLVFTAKPLPVQKAPSSRRHSATRQLVSSVQGTR